MNVLTSISEMQQLMKEKIREGYTIGFVPTMGFLHEGHLNLVKDARENNDIVVMSVFVNPLQFGPNEDYESYPRNVEQDQQLAKEAGVDILFYPTAKEMYPDEEQQIKMNVTKRTDVLCGKSRPGHFDGVIKVVTKLFHIVMPDQAYFGMKDAQQVAVIEGLVSELNFPVKIVPVQTVREEDGLAKSSRNVNLLPDEREEAPAIYQSLLLAKDEIFNNGERSVESISKMIMNNVTSQTSGVIDYIEILSYPKLNPLQTISGEIIIAIAVKFTNARLIDNITLNV